MKTLRFASPTLLLALIFLSPRFVSAKPDAGNLDIGRANTALAATRREVRLVMGTLLDITLCTESDVSDSKRHLDAAFGVAAHYDRLLSSYKPNSDVNRISAAPIGAPISVHEDTVGFLRFAAEVFKKSGGLVDITAGRLIAALRAGTTSRKYINHLQSEIGLNAIKIHSSNLVSRETDIAIDTGGLGKGYAVDKIVELMKVRGVRCGLINFGYSSIYGFGRGWKLQFPLLKDSALTFFIKDQGISVSFSKNDQGQAHIVDIFQGKLVTKDIQSVVIAPTASWAEAGSKVDVVSSEIDHETIVRFADSSVNCPGNGQKK